MNAITELEKIPQSEWPAIYCSLNRWTIPDQLIHLKPDWWPETLSESTIDPVKNFIRPLMDHIRKHIPDEVLSREWNKDTMTDEQHKKWYHTPDHLKLP